MGTRSGKRRLKMVVPVLAAVLITMAAPVFATPSAFAAENLDYLVPTATKVSATDQQTIVSKHNKYRDEVSVAHLSWDDGLAAHAQRWADKLAADDNGLSHGDPANADHYEGENLAWVNGSNLSAASAPDMWYREKAVYDGTPIGQSNSGARHYTQMVWSTTTSIGCGAATGASGKLYTSCRYSPVGNITGQLPYSGGHPSPGNGRHPTRPPGPPTTSSTPPHPGQELLDDEN